MEPRALGPTGLRVSPLCLGAMNFGDPHRARESARIIDAALAGGITMIDTADVYAGGRSEELVGDALAANGRRDDIVLATKVECPGATRHPERGTGAITSCSPATRRCAVCAPITSTCTSCTVRPASYRRPETLAAFDELVQAGRSATSVCSTHPAGW